VLGDYLAVASLAIFGFIAIASIFEPKAIARLFAKARPEVREALQKDAEAFSAVIRMIGFVWLILAVLIFVTVVLPHGR